MQSTLEKSAQPTLMTYGEGEPPVPPDEVAQRNGDGEGDGQQVADGIKQAEAYANEGNFLEVGGIQLTNTLYRVAGHNRRRRAGFSISTGHLAVRHEVPVFLN